MSKTRKRPRKYAATEVQCQTIVRNFTLALLQMAPQWGVVGGPTNPPLFVKQYTNKILYYNAVKAKGNSAQVQDCVENAFCGILEKSARFKGLTWNRFIGFVHGALKISGLRLAERYKTESTRYVSIEDMGEDTTETSETPDPFRDMLIDLSALNSSQYRDATLREGMERMLPSMVLGLSVDVREYLEFVKVLGKTPTTTQLMGPASPLTWVRVGCHEGAKLSREAVQQHVRAIREEFFHVWDTEWQQPYPI